MANEVQNKTKRNQLAIEANGNNSNNGGISDSKSDSTDEATTVICQNFTCRSASDASTADEAADEDEDCVTEILAEEEEEAGIEGDDDDSDIEAHHSNGWQSSASSRLSTPPPTGEDDSTSSSPAKTTPAKLIATNLYNLNQKSSKLRGSCKSCEYVRSNNIRKASSLKGAKELQAQNGCHCSCYSKSAPSMTACGTVQQTLQHNHHYHHHSHQHHIHNQHQHHHYHHSHGHGACHHHCHHGGCSTSTGSVATTSSSAECDKIPKIVGKLGNLDSMQYYANATGGAEHVVTNGIGQLTPNGHFNYLPGNLLMRRHSETNGPMPTTLNASKIIAPHQTAAMCDK